MEYKFIKIDKENEAVLISANGVQLWVDYFIEIEDGENFYTWDFNQYIFNLYNSKDIEARETQKKIYEDVEAFDCFMDNVFYDYLEN